MDAVIFLAWLAIGLYFHRLQVKTDKKNLLELEERLRRKD